MNKPTIEWKNGDKFYVSSPDKVWTVVGIDPHSAIGSVVGKRDGCSGEFSTFSPKHMLPLPSEEELAGKGLWELRESLWFTGSLTEWDDLTNSEKEVWVELAKKVTINE